MRQNVKIRHSCNKIGMASIRTRQHSAHQLVKVHWSLKKCQHFCNLNSIAAMPRSSPLVLPIWIRSDDVINRARLFSLMRGKHNTAPFRCYTSVVIIGYPCLNTYGVLWYLLFLLPEEACRYQGRGSRRLFSARCPSFIERICMSNDGCT